jgi:phenylalanyl-tRNA synthetase alpha chain
MDGSDDVDDVDHLRGDVLAAIDAAGDVAALEQIRIAELGKKGRISGRMKALGGMDPEARRVAGAALNTLRDEVSQALQRRREALADSELDAPRRRAHRRHPAGAPEPTGSHPPDQPDHRRVVAIFGEMGFAVAEGPDIEDDWHNFTALNIPPEHPARQEMHDTFYLPGAGRQRARAAHPHLAGADPHHAGDAAADPHHRARPHLPLRHDATHSPMFHQVEGLVIDEATHMGHLKGCLIDFCRAFFGVDDLPVRFRPSYFPFTEPSAEVDIGCSREGGGLTIGAGDDWLEILGCGMVHPKVLENCGIDPDPLPGLRLRHGHRAHRHAEVRHPGPAHLLRVRPALAAALRLRAAGRAVLVGGLTR